MNFKNLKCKNCNNDITVNERFCPKCGTRNEAFIGGQTTQNVQNNNNYNNQNFNSMNQDIANYSSFNNANSQYQSNSVNMSSYNSLNDVNINPNNAMNNNRVANNKTNSNAISSIVCGIISFFIFGWLSYVGLACGIQALCEIKKKGGRGKALAIIGIIVSAISALLYIAVTVIYD